jgi:hypothetical protein
VSENECPWCGCASRIFRVLAIKGERYSSNTYMCGTEVVTNGERRYSQRTVLCGAVGAQCVV